jgi:dynein heavy chain
MLNKEKPVFLHASENPGYAGRTKLPLLTYKTFGFIVPDFALIAEIMLYTEGIESAHKISQMLVNLINVFRKKLIPTDWYDFGLRKFKRICKTVGLLKRAEPLKDDLTIVSLGLAMTHKPHLNEDDRHHFDVLLKEHGFTVEDVDSSDVK